VRTARRAVGIVFGVGLLIAVTGGLVARYVEIPGHRTLYAVIASPYLIPAALIALLFFALSRRWLMAAVAGCLSVALLMPQLPWYVSADTDPNEVAVRVMTANMRFGKADPRALADLAAGNADVVMLQELTPQAVRGLTAAGMDDVFPHRVLDARSGAAGVGIYSRYPMSDIARIPGYQLAMVKARVRVDGAANEASVLSVHFAAPWPQPIADWHSDFAKFPATLKDFAAQSDGAPILIGGDFNATIDMKPFRELLTDGYRDGAEQAGAGRELTFPANRRFPPFMGLDHVLTRNCTAVSSRTVEIPGTDHRAVLVTVMLPRASS
jgi:endonuclease/exonuclease/phosphatase (EEP) superfamily protein YafD